MKKHIMLTAIFMFSSAFSQSPSELNRTGVEKAKRGNVSEATKDFDEALRKNNVSAAKAYHNMGWAYEQQGDAEKALQNYEAAVERNPLQSASHERLCEIYLNFEKYDACIVAGEKVLSLDSSNKNVIPWLERAYMERFKIRSREISDREREALKQQAVQSMKEQKDEKKRNPVVSFGVLGSSRWTYGGSGEGFSYTETPGFSHVNFPCWAFVDVTPNALWKISASGGVPYFGALLPEVVNNSEFAEVSYLKDDVYIGAGIMGNHYRGSGVWGNSESFNDYKVGFLLGVYGKSSLFTLRFYPDLMPYDAGYEATRTLDVSFSEIAYSYYGIKNLSLNFKFSTAGFTFYDHAVKLSNYAGVYAFSGGVEFAAGKRVKLRADFTERCYMLDFLCDRPYSFMNGQGFFGFNRFKWFKGDPMSGLDCYSSALSFYIEETANEYLSFFQSISGELCPPSKKKHDIVFTVGFKGNY